MTEIFVTIFIFSCNEGDNWDWNALDGLLPNQVISKLAAFVLSEEGDEEDGVRWGRHESRLFTVRSSYCVATNIGNEFRDPF